eukprot:39662-Chlamydomonas_euryale.AAC.1
MVSQRADSLLHVCLKNGGSHHVMALLLGLPEEYPHELRPDVHAQVMPRSPAHLTRLIEACFVPHMQTLGLQPKACKNQACNTRHANVRRATQGTRAWAYLQAYESMHRTPTCLLAYLHACNGAARNGIDGAATARQRVHRSDNAHALWSLQTQDEHGRDVLSLALWLGDWEAVRGRRMGGGRRCGGCFNSGRFLSADCNAVSYV